MSLKPLNPESYQAVAQAMLAYFDREDVNIPGNMVESIVSGKSLMRALLGGQLVLAQNQPASQAEVPPAPQEEEPEVEQKVDEKAA